MEIGTIQSSATSTFSTTTSQPSPRYWQLLSMFHTPVTAPTVQRPPRMVIRGVGAAERKNHITLAGSMDVWMTYDMMYIRTAGVGIQHFSTGVGDIFIDRRTCRAEASELNRLYMGGQENCYRTDQ